ncbi:MAG TPA: alpha/beta hydrolase [Dehalococcoidia bacterium]|nr:alpha/beta hydrolase [Dehalococcoidia bacterium]
MPDAQPSRMQHHFIEGVPRLHYSLSGQGDLPTLVLLHGSTQHARAWDDVAPKLPEYRVAALDLRGHGESEWNGAYSPDDYLNDVDRLIDVLDVPSVALAGHSMGSLIAMRYTAARPDRVSAAIFVDIDARPPDSQGENLHRAGARDGLSFDSSDEAWARVTRLRPDAQDDAVERIMAANFLPRGGGYIEGYDRQTLAQFAPWDNRELLTGIECPTLVLRGGASMVHSRDAADEMMRTLPNGRFHEFPNLSHLLHLEQPEQIAAAMHGFLRETGNGA